MTGQMNKISYDTGSESWLSIKTGETRRFYDHEPV